MASSVDSGESEDLVRRDAPEGERAGDPAVIHRSFRRANGPTPTGEKIEVADVLRTLYAGRYTVGLCVIGVMVLVGIITALVHPTFIARGSIYLGDLQTKPSNQGGVSDQLDFIGGRNGDVGTEIEILQSRDLLDEAIVAAGLNVTIERVGTAAPRYWRWRVGGRNLGLFDLADGLTVTGTLRSQTASKPVRVSLIVEDPGHFRLVDPQRGQSDEGSLEKPLTTANISLTVSNPGAAAIPKGTAYELTVAPIEEIEEDVEKSLSISIPKAPGASLTSDSVRVATVEFKHHDPSKAAAFVKDLIHAYLERRQSWKTQEAAEAESFVAKQLENVKAQLDDAEKQLVDYKQRTEVVVLGDAAQSLINQAGQYEQQRLAAQLQLDSFSQISAALKNGSAPLERYLVGEAPDPVLVNLSNSLAQAQQELHRLEERFTNDAPAVVEQRAQVASQLAMVQNYVNGRRTRAQQQLSSLNRVLGRFDDKLKTVPRAEIELAQLTRRVDLLNRMYSFLSEHEQQAVVGKASAMSRNHILDSPGIPHREGAPRVLLNLAAGAALGIFLGLIVVIIRRLTDPTFQTESELRQDIGEFPLLALVPRRPGKKRHDRNKDPEPPIDIFAAEPRSEFTEAFRHLRTSIYQTRHRSGKAMVVLITSPTPGDGKTLCTLSLATSLVADGKRVLVIEGDLHRPVHHLVFRQSADPGVSSILQRDDLIRTVSAAAGQFDAIVAGKPDGAPAELLSSRQFDALLKYARERYDFILIDSPPFPLLSDALIIAAHADQVISVIRLRTTDRRVAEDHLSRFAATALRYGVVINDSDQRLSSRHGYGYGYGKQLDVAP